MAMSPVAIPLFSQNTYTNILMYYWVGNMVYMPSYDLPYQERAEMTLKTTAEIRKLLKKSKLNFESFQNEALNAYLPRIFPLCPFTEEICTKKHCMNCEILKKSAKK